MVLVTGGTGFIGSWLIRKLCKSGHDVLAIKRKQSIIPEDLSKQDNLRWIECDILDYPRLEQICRQVRQVYHCAALISHERQHRQQMMKINVDGTANIVNAALYTGVEKMLYFSSVAALGFPVDSGVIDENVLWIDSDLNSTYGLSKFLGELEVWRGIEEGLQAVIVNPSTVIGPGDPSTGIRKWFSRVQNGMTFYPDGGGGFVDVRDVVEIAVRLMNLDITGERFIVSAENLSYKAVFEMIARALHVNPPGRAIGNTMAHLIWASGLILAAIPGLRPPLTREVAARVGHTFIYDNSKIRQLLDYTFIPVKESIAFTARAILQKPSKNNPERQVILQE